MSQAFVRESDEQWLHDVGPTVSALVIYLSGQNNNIRVYEIKTTMKNEKEIHHMSNGLLYAKDKTVPGKFQINIKQPQTYLNNVIRSSFNAPTLL